MDIKDVSDDSKFIGYLKQLQGAAERAARRKGQAVRDHPPSQQLVSSFLMKLMVTSYRPQSDENTNATTQVPAPYSPCIASAKDLEPIMISDMRLKTHHRGKKVILRVLTPPDRMTAVMAIVEDEKGIAVLLQLYHQPEEIVVPATEILSPNMVCILKEPFFKCATDGAYSLRVDHPSDIIWLDGADNRIPSHWRPSLVISVENSTDIRKQGQAVQQPRQALLDAEKAINPAIPSEKSLFRKARALYELGDYQHSLEMLENLTQSFPGNKAASSEKHRINERLNEQRTGEYKFKQIYKQAEKSPPFINCTTFSAPVEIRESPGRGKGLFTTKAVSAGELLLCEKAFSYSFAGDEQSTKQTKILMNLATKRMVMGGQARLLTLIVQKLYHNSSLSAEFEDLHHADYQKTTVLETDRTPVVDSSVFKRRKVLIDSLQRLLGQPGSGKVAKASRLMKALEETYPTNNDCAIRLELWQPYFAFGAHLLENNKLHNAAKMILKGFKALGYSIIACPPNDITDRPQLEVKRWGMATDAMPWAFYNLVNVYRQLSPELCLAAEHYAEVSYTMLVGEKETWPDVFSSSS
ncbi:TPR domain [Fusarium acutatum]|uniref:TPR domain n=1 Tax=Fusarium acutatum TaxID=78861 RepID=A0A8H4NHK0_9HYPO|nr:TPR domain [Fusarium acutatum]